MQIHYTIEQNLQPAEFVDLLIRSTLSHRRPIDDSERIEMMLKHGNLIVTARLKGTLIGVSRALTDFVFCTYLSELAVDIEYQNTGVGKRLIDATQRAAPQAMLILLAAPAAQDYYGKIGMTKFEHCFLLPVGKNLDL